MIPVLCCSVGLLSVCEADRQASRMTVLVLRFNGIVLTVIGLLMAAKEVVEAILS